MLISIKILKYKYKEIENNSIYKIIIYAEFK